MSCNDTKTTDSHVVSDLDEIIDLSTFTNNGIAQRATVNRRIRTNLDIVLYNDSAKLGNFLQTGWTWNVTETVLSNSHTWMKRNLVANKRTLDGHARCNIAVTTNLAAFANNRR